MLWPHGLWPTKLLHPWDFPDKNTEVGFYVFVQEIFPTQGVNLSLLLCRCLLYCWVTREAPMPSTELSDHLLLSFLTKFQTLVVLGKHWLYVKTLQPSTRLHRSPRYLLNFCWWHFHMQGCLLSLSFMPTLLHPSLYYSESENVSCSVLSDSLRFPGL